MTLSELQDLIDEKVPSGARPKIKAKELRDVLYELAAAATDEIPFDDSDFVKLDGSRPMTGDLNFPDNYGPVWGANTWVYGSGGNLILAGQAGIRVDSAMDFNSNPISGITTIDAANLILTGTLDVTGDTTLNVLNVNGVSNFNDVANFNANTIINATLYTNGINAGNQAITNVPLPEINSDVANKLYVDTNDAFKLDLAGGTMTGSLLMSSAIIDSTATGGTDTLNIGTTNAEVINIGNAGATVNIIGAYVFEYSVNAYVTDKLFTLNKNGGASTGVGTGFEIEENAVITGYFKTNGSRNGFSMKSPANAGVLDIITLGTDVVLTAGNTGTIATLAGAEAFTNKTYSGLTISTTTGTLTVSNGKTLTLLNTLAFSGTDSSNVAFGGGGTVAYVANKLSIFAATTSAELAGVISDETGTGALVFANTPTLVTPILGIASATSINKLTITAPVSGSTLTIQDGFTLTVSGNANVSGTNTGDQTIAGLSPLTTKGDLFTYSSVNARLGVGVDNSTLVADATAATGLKWVTGATKNNFTSASAPAVTDDSSAGYSVGSRWIDTSTMKYYILKDATISAAVWEAQLAKLPYTVLTDAATIAISMASRGEKDFYLDTSRTAITFTYSNFVDASVAYIKVKKTSASNLTITLPTSIPGTTLTLIGAANSYFEICIEAHLLTAPSTYEYYTSLSVF